MITRQAQRAAVLREQLAAAEADAELEARHNALATARDNVARLEEYLPKYKEAQLAAITTETEWRNKEATIVRAMMRHQNEEMARRRKEAIERGEDVYIMVGGQVQETLPMANVVFVPLENPPGTTPKEAQLLAELKKAREQQRRWAVEFNRRSRQVGECKTGIEYWKNQVFELEIELGLRERPPKRMV